MLAGKRGNSRVGERKVPCDKLPISPPTPPGSTRKTETQIGGAPTLREPHGCSKVFPIKSDTDLASVTQDDLDALAQRLNSVPRKVWPIARRMRCFCPGPGRARLPAHSLKDAAEADRKAGAGRALRRAKAPRSPADLPLNLGDDSRIGSVHPHPAWRRTSVRIHIALGNAQFRRIVARRRSSVRRGSYPRPVNANGAILPWRAAASVTSSRTIW